MKTIEQKAEEYANFHWPDVDSPEWSREENKIYCGFSKNDFLAGANEILSNPEKYGLMKIPEGEENVYYLRPED